MKTFTASKNEIVKKAQQYIDSFPDGSVVALAYNEDTALLNFKGKKTIEVMDCAGLLSNRFSYDVSVDQYTDEEIDLAVLGLGYKAQIGFNEVGTPYDSIKRCQKLTDSTKEEYSAFGPVPDMGVTLGIGDLVKAKNIMVLALGDKRAEAVYNMLYARDDSIVPAAFLQLPPNVMVFTDEEAGSKL